MPPKGSSELTYEDYLMTYRRKLLAGLSTMGFAFCCAAPASATVSLYAKATGVNNGAILLLGSDNGTGVFSYSGNYGSFYNSITAVGAPVLSSPSLLSQAISVSGSTAGSLSLFIVQSGVTGSSTDLLSTLTANAFTGAVSSVTLSTFASAVNPFSLSGSGGYDFSASQLAAQTFSGAGSYTSTNSVSGITGPYYEIARYDVSMGNGGGSANNTINLQQGINSAVPEPATWGMMLLGFAAVGYAMRRRAKVSARIQFA